MMYTQLLGCFIMGVMSYFKPALFVQPRRPVWRILYIAVTSGLCGSITTFSSWSMECSKNLFLQWDTTSGNVAASYNGGRALEWLVSLWAGVALPIAALRLGLFFGQQCANMISTEKARMVQQEPVREQEQVQVQEQEEGRRPSNNEVGGVNNVEMTSILVAVALDEPTTIKTAEVMVATTQTNDLIDGTEAMVSADHNLRGQRNPARVSTETVTSTQTTTVIITTTITAWSVWEYCLVLSFVLSTVLITVLTFYVYPYSEYLGYTAGEFRLLVLFQQFYWLIC
jgi:fluoride ion exporter CrcB/FEX